MGIRTDTKCNSTHTVTDGENPCNLGLINRKMRAAWAVDTLLVQNFGACRRRKRINLNKSLQLRQDTCGITRDKRNAPLPINSIHGDCAASYERRTFI